MTEIVFGELEEVMPRSAWQNEARHFTPWLADNLGRLGSAVGLSLELVQAEMAVGRYSADILARTLDGAAVLIENQLEYSDHTHLGQILTYLTGLKAETVIWVAPFFREEHLSAIRWLNENTKDPFSFFAVKVRVVKIGSSPLAPLFEVLEKPNGFDRQVEQIAQAAQEVDATTLRRRKFWHSYRDRYPDIAADIGSGGGASIWHKVAGTDFIISQWLSKDGVGLFVRNDAGFPIEKTVQRLMPHKDALETALGARLEDPKFPLISRSFGDVEKAEDCERQASWLHDRLLMYCAELQKFFGSDT